MRHEETMPLSEPSANDGMFDMGRVLVLGAGKSGRAAEFLLKRQGHEVLVLDGDVPFPGDDARCSFAVVSPGVALTHPWIVEARRRGLPLKSELQLGCEELRRRGWKLLAVTGSKGKSSVVKIVAEALGGVPCGNYGLPVSEVAHGYDMRRETEDGGAAHWAVVEVSSFMMETTVLPSDAFEAAAILNLQEDHLDRHGSVAVYHGLKRKLLTMAKRPISPLFCDDAHVAMSELALLKGSYFDNEILRENGLCAIALMRAAGVDDARIAAAFRGFVPLPHRMNPIAERNGVRFIDDSKSTSLAALVAGVKMAAPVIRPSIRLIAGGLPKGDDPKRARATLTERVKKVYLIGQSAEAFCAAWEGAVDCEICGTMNRAVQRALGEAESGETVLLSPGTASFDQFRSFGERGDVFADLVKRESESK